MPWFVNSLTHALAEFASHGATAEETNGARKFINCLVSLPADAQEELKFPVRTLSTFDTEPPTK